MSELSYKELLTVDGGCGLCTAGYVIGAGGAFATVAACFTPAAPVIIIAFAAGAGLGYLVAP